MRDNVFKITYLNEYPKKLGKMEIRKNETSELEKEAVAENNQRYKELRGKMRLGLDDYAPYQVAIENAKKRGALRIGSIHRSPKKNND